MNINLCLIDCSSNQILFEGIGKKIEDRKYNLYEFGNKQHLYKWKSYGKGMIIESISEVKVHLVLIQDKLTKGYIETEFGRMEVECFTQFLQINNNKIEIKYALNDQNFHFVLKGGLYDAIH